MICLCLVCAFVFGMGALAEDTAASSYVMAGLELNTSRDWANNDFFKRMAEKTGISFTFNQYSENEKWREAKAEMLETGKYPDVLFKANLSQTETIEMMNRGMLLDLSQYINEENCPNLWALLQQHPEYLEAITLPDGKIGALPQIQDYSVQNYMWINEKWLKNLGLSEPTTAQELVDVLTAFKTMDPNRNGKADEIPLGFIGPFDLKFLGHAFGLVANDYNIFAEDGKVQFMPLQEEYRTFITWLKDLYQAGLIDQQGFSIVDTMRTVTDSKAAATYGIILTNNISNIFQVDWSTDYTILIPLSYEGRQQYRNFAGNVVSGTFAITTACENPEAVLGWVDYLYSEDGAILASVGQQNVDFVVDGDQSWRYLDHVSSNSYFTIFALIDGVPFYPGIQASDFQMRMSGLSDAQRAPLKRQAQMRSMLVMPFPYYALDAAQAAEISPLQNAIASYVDLQIGRWLLGEEEISDTSFAAFEEKLNDLGLDEFLAFWQDVLDRN